MFGDSAAALIQMQFVCMLLMVLALGEVLRDVNTRNLKMDLA